MVLQDHKNLNLQSRMIKDIQKRLRVVEEDALQTVDLVKQPDLKVDKTARVPKLHVRGTCANSVNRISRCVSRCFLCASGACWCHRHSIRPCWWRPAGH
jgi:hypothetical protein